MALRPIPGYDPARYRAGRDGQIYFRRGKTWVAFRVQVRRGQPVVELLLPDGRRHKASVAGLVCRAYHGSRPIGCQPYHWPDTSPLNCHADNLRWAPAGTAMLGRPGDRERLREIGAAAAKRHLRKLTARQVRWARRARSRGATLDAIAEQLGVTKGTASKMLSGLTYRDIPD